MLIEASVGSHNESLVEAARNDTRLVTANKQDSRAFRIEREGDAPHAAVGAKTHFLHVRVFGAAQGIYSGTAEAWSKLLKQPDPCDQLDTHRLRQGASFERKLGVKLDLLIHTGICLEIHMPSIA